MEDEIDIFMYTIGERLKKKPEAMQPFIDKLKENWYDSIDSLRDIDDDTWNTTLKFPSRLVKVIKDELSGPLSIDEEMIDTAPKKESQKIRDIHMEHNDDQERPVATLVKDSKSSDSAANKGIYQTVYPFIEELASSARECLRDFYKEAKDDAPTICKSLKTLITVIQNIVSNPMEPKYRSLNISKKAMQEKICQYKSLMGFLNLCGFEQKESEMVLKGFPGEYLKQALDTIYDELKINGTKFGVTVKSNFDPYAEAISSTTGQRISSGAAETSQYNPSYIDKMIEEERQFKKKLLERSVEDREIKVFNTLSGDKNFKQMMRVYEEENLKEDEEYEENLRKASALKLMGENAKNQKFGNKRLQEYEKLRSQKVYSTTMIRIKFPDGLVLQGKFGAREKFSKVIEFVKENIFEKDREFYLFKAPPKKIIKETNDTLKKLDLVPSGMVYFQWCDEDLATSSTNIALDMKKLKDNVEVF